MSKRGFKKVGFYISNELLNSITKFKENYDISLSATYNLLLHYGLSYHKDKFIVPDKDNIPNESTLTALDIVNLIDEV